MNIKSFIIEGLFNRFNHRIEFKNNITIIIGKNGVGKTTCLELLYSLFCGDFSKLREVPYHTITLEFTDGEKLTFSYDKSLTVYSQLVDKTYILEKVDCVIPEFLSKKIEENKVEFIKSQRLLEYNEDPNSSYLYYVDTVVIINARNLSNQIKNIIANAADIAAKLDKTFPSRLLDGNGGKIKKSDELKKNLSDLEIKRRELSMVGLLSAEIESEEPITDNISENSVNVLSLYVQDSWAKLQPYEKIAEKLLLFKRIINSRFLYKKMTIDKDKGYFFVSDEGKEIPIDKLSSGEQNELVMFYNLLFECNENNLILIDEPEISMHIEWLNNMLPDLMAISELNGLSMLIATHSPDFIGEYWNLTTELK